MGHGPPNLFITLSCAEYYWKDIARLLRQRFSFGSIKNPLSGEDVHGRINTVKNVNDFSIIVQEYFQKRVENWLKTVGKKVFKINHFWLRYEFAPTRGQIHAHMLAITNYNQLLQNAMNVYKDHTNMADFLSKWMEQSFGVTATMPVTADVNVLPCQEIQDRATEQAKRAKKILEHPSNFTLTDIDRGEIQKSRNQNLVETSIHVADRANLFRTLQMHTCNTYCMRKRSFLYVLSHVESSKSYTQHSNMCFLAVKMKLPNRKKDADAVQEQE